jgi:hypothetical protein
MFISEPNREREDIMYTLRLIPIIPLLLAFTSILPAQPADSDNSTIPILGRSTIERLTEAEANYANGLASDNDGLVESSLYYALQMRLTFPERDFTRLEKAVDKLVANGRSVGIRYKALLASTVFAAPGIIDRGSVEDIADSDRLFSVVANQLESKLLVHKN